MSQCCSLNKKRHNTFVFISYSLLPGSVKTFRERFTRNSSMRLSAIPERQIFNTTVETCAERCVKETGFHCKSFDVDNVRKRCILYTVDREDLHVTLIEDSDRDHYGGV